MISTEGETKTFTLSLPEDYRETDLAGREAEFSVAVHWVKERQLPEVDETFLQQVGDYSDAAELRSAVELQILQRERERVREQMETAALDKLVEIASIEYPPQLVEHQAQHMLEPADPQRRAAGLTVSAVSAPGRQGAECLPG